MMKRFVLTIITIDRKKPQIYFIMVIWLAWTIVVGAISVLEVGALSYNKDVASAKNELSGSFMKPTMLRDKRDLASQSRIVGGNDADIGKYPFFVEWDLCGASLIHKGKQHRNPSCQPCVACACSQLTLSFSTHTRHHSISSSL
jgi:hypothetical protein